MKKTGVAEECGKGIRDSLSRWHYIFENGGSDPFWEDGVNLNLVRNHILYFKQRCEEELTPDEYPPEYYFKVPPEVDSGYMARKDEIRRNAVLALEKYKKDENYQYLTQIFPRMNENDIKATSVNRVVHYVIGLEDALKNDDFVSMRRHERPEEYLDSFKECREKVEHIIHQDMDFPAGQLELSMFGLFDT